MQCSLFIKLCLGSIGNDSVISESHYKRLILQRNYSNFPINTLLNSMLNSMVKNGNHNTTLFYPNPCYNEVCYKCIAL